MNIDWSKMKTGKDIAAEKKADADARRSPDPIAKLTAELDALRARVAALEA